MKQEKNELQSKLCYTSKDAAKTFSAEKKDIAFQFAEGYKNFLNESKTEREAVKFALCLAKEYGYIPFEYGMDRRRAL